MKIKMRRAGFEPAKALSQKISRLPAFPSGRALSMGAFYGTTPFGRFGISALSFRGGQAF
jgi:hypothetical protein